MPFQILTAFLKPNSRYLDRESPSDLAKLTEPELYFLQNTDKLLILDEVQRTPGLFQILRSVIDKHRKNGKESGQFLLLGSASLDLLQQSAESLAGRIFYFELTGLLETEINIHDFEEVNKLWLRGGFPSSFLASSTEKSLSWRQAFIRSY